MSPQELQVLQSLGNRRTQLDAREQNMDTQLQLLAAAEAKVDLKLKQLAGMKGDIQGLLGQADTKKDTEMARLVTIYEQMPPAAAATPHDPAGRRRAPAAGGQDERAQALRHHGADAGRRRPRR